MSLSPRLRMLAMLHANRRAGELAASDGSPWGRRGVVRGAATHSLAYLLQALDEQGWDLAPKARGDRYEAPDTALIVKLREFAESEHKRGLIASVARLTALLDEHEKGAERSAMDHLPASRGFCDEFIEHPTDAHGGTYCKRLAGHDGECSPHYPKPKPGPVS